MSSEERERGGLERAAMALISGIVIVAPLALGAVHLPVVLALLGAALVALALILWSRRPGPVRWPVLASPFALLGAWGLLQLLPLGQPLHGWLDPAGWQLYLEGARAAGIDPGARPLSLDPARTADRIARYALLVVALMAVSNLPRTRWRQRWLGATVLGAGALTLAVGGLQDWAAPGLYLGFYQADRPPTWGSTFVNWNQASSLYAACAMVAAAFAMPGRDTSRDATRRRRVALALVFVCLGPTLLHESLGSWLMVLGAGALLVLAGSSRRLERAGALVVGGIAALVGAWALAWALAWGRVARGWLRGWPWPINALERAHVARATLRVSAEHARVGAGLGAVERTIYPHLGWAEHRRVFIEVAEHELLEWLLGAGWLVGGLAVALLLAAWLAPLAVRRDGPRQLYPVAFGAFVVGIAQLHFPFFMVGLGLALLVWWQACLERGLMRTESHEGWRGALARRARLTLLWRHGVAAGLVVALAGLGAGALSLASAPPPDEALAEAPRAELEALIHQIPSEGRVYMGLARHALEADELERAARLARRAWALEAMPHARILLAHTLWRAGEREAAVVHYRTTWASSHDIELALRSSLELAREPAQRAQLLGPARPKIWRRAAGLVAATEGRGAALDLALALVEARPQDVEAHALVLDLYGQAGRAELALLWARSMFYTDFEDRERAAEVAYQAWIDNLIALGQRERALEVIERALEELPEHEALAWRVLELAGARSEWSPEMAARVEDAFARACRGTLRVSQRRRCNELRARRLEHRGELEEAERQRRLIMERTQDPRQLASFLVRRRRCAALRHLAARWRARADEQLEAWFDRQIARCERGIRQDLEAP